MCATMSSVVGLARCIAHAFGPLGSPPDDSAPFSSTQALIDPLVAWILPLWEDAASNLGLPRTLDGIARLHRAVAVVVRSPCGACGAVPCP